MIRNFHSACILRQILVNLFLDSNRPASHKIHKRKQLLSLLCRRLGVQFDTGMPELQRADGCKKNTQFWNRDTFFSLAPVFPAKQQQCIY
jgi:hypothetical protein